MKIYDCSRGDCYEVKKYDHCHDDCREKEKCECENRCVECVCCKCHHHRDCTEHKC